MSSALSFGVFIGAAAACRVRFVSHDLGDLFASRRHPLDVLCEAIRIDHPLIFRSGETRDQNRTYPWEILTKHGLRNRRYVAHRMRVLEDYGADLTQPCSWRCPVRGCGARRRALALGST
jgi:hypothetical protein